MRLAALIIGGTLAYLFLPRPWWIVAIVGLAAVDSVEIWFWLRLRRRRPTSGTEALVGEKGVLASPSRVRIHGTSYPAEVADGQPGDRVIVERVEGMRLIVRRAP